MAGRILIIDDDHLIRKLLRDFFELLGYEVLCLERARDALSRVKAECFDIVITDYSMPDMDGIELTRLIRQIRPSLPIIGISAACDERRFLDAGADHFIPKPFELKRLRKTVEEHLNQLK